MKKINYSLLIISILILQACESGKFYKKYEDIAQFQWKKSEPIKFEVDIQDTQKPYQIEAGFRYVSYFSYKEIKFDLSIKSPSGKIENKSYSIPLKDEGGEHIGSVMGNLADIEKVIEKNFKFTEKGKYLFELKHALPPDDLGGMMEVGLLLEKGK